MESTQFACPHCQGRLVRGSTSCLHCGADVVAPPDETGGVLRSFMVRVLVVLVLLGGLSVFLMPMLVGEEEEPEVVEPRCFSASDPASMQELMRLRSSGWREAPPRGEERCLLPPHQRPSADPDTP